MRSDIPVYRMWCPEYAEPCNLSARTIVCSCNGKELGTERHEDGTIGLKDFDPFEKELNICHEITIGEPRAMFHGAAAIAGPDAVLALALEWQSKSSGICGVTFGEEFTAISQAVDCRLSVRFEPGMLRGTLTVRPKLFVKKPSPEKGRGICRLAGGLLGNIGEGCTFRIDGSGSTFPVLEESRPGEPPWNLAINLDNPLEDPFSSDYFKLVINSAHRDYPKYCSQDSIPAATRELLSAAMFALIVKLQAQPEWESIKNGKAAPGTVGQAVWYWLHKKDVDTSSPEKTLETIRKIWEGK